MLPAPSMPICLAAQRSCSIVVSRTTFDNAAFTISLEGACGWRACSGTKARAVSGWDWPGFGPGMYTTEEAPAEGPGTNTADAASIWGVACGTAGCGVYAFMFFLATCLISSVEWSKSLYLRVSLSKPTTSATLRFRCFAPWRPKSSIWAPLQKKCGSPSLRRSLQGALISRSAASSSGDSPSPAMAGSGRGSLPGSAREGPPGRARPTPARRRRAASPGA
mmetsp:Transcript_7398/g.19965  ORF Transcript_7398/g.19965 Transcript_7398/m.19965 type:complete len:221 (+) Transcript_7398:938-1600(+)